jgi:DNA-nicking Smr family endonuclease
MNFGDILDEWDRSTAKPYGKKKIDSDRADRDRACNNGAGNNGAGNNGADCAAKELPRANPMDVWLRRYGLEDKDADLDESGRTETPAERRKRLRAMRSEAVLDLHGLTREEAWARLDSFIADCVRRKLLKVLVIHGKGAHSENDPVLKQMVRTFIEQNPHAGESGPGDKGEGGSGSTWILLK